MTCIIAAEANGKVYMGADSVALDRTYDFDVIEGSKMFRRGEMLIGCAGQPRQAQIVKHYAHLPSQPSDINKTLPGYRDRSDDQYLMAFIENIRTALRDYGCMEMENGIEAGCNLIIGYHGKVYAVENHFQIHRSRRGCIATGVGAPYALASLLTSMRPPVSWERVDMTDKITVALQIASQLCVAVYAPFQVEVLEA